MIKNQIISLASSLAALGPSQLTGTVESEHSVDPTAVHNAFQLEVPEGSFQKTAGLTKYDYTAKAVFARQWSQDNGVQTATELLLDLLEQIENSVVSGQGSSNYQTITDYSILPAEFDQGILLLSVSIGITAT